MLFANQSKNPTKPLASGLLSGKYSKGEGGFSGEGRLDATRDVDNPAFKKISDRNWKIVAELETVAKDLGRSMAQVAVNWTVNRPGIASVIVGASKLSQLEDNIKALDFEIPTELLNRLESVSKPEAQFPYTFFDAEIQGMIHGGATVGVKRSSTVSEACPKDIGNRPNGYQPGVLIESAGGGVS